MTSINLTEKDKGILSIMAENLDVPYTSVLSYLEQNPDVYNDFKLAPQINPRSYNRETRKLMLKSSKISQSQENKGGRCPIVRKREMRDRLREKLAQKKLTQNEVK